VASPRGRERGDATTGVLNGVADPESRVEAFLPALRDAASKLRDRMREDGERPPGAQEAIVALVRTVTAQSVVTGNARAVAVTKLEALDLAQHIDFEIGGLRGGWGPTVGLATSWRSLPRLLAVGRLCRCAAPSQGRVANLRRGWEVGFCREPICNVSEVARIRSRPGIQPALALGFWDF